MLENIQKESDEILIVRALCKLSSAIDNIDNLDSHGTIRFSGKMKRDILKFIDFYVRHTNDEITEMTIRDWESYNEITNYWFSDYFDNSFSSGNKSKKELLLFLAKIKSALKDLNKLNNIMHNKIFAGPIIVRIENLFSKGYIKRLDLRNKGFFPAVDFLNELGKEIIQS